MAASDARLSTDCFLGLQRLLTRYELINTTGNGSVYLLLDQTANSSETLLLAMALFPDVQAKAQAELDRVVGPDRLPEFDDLEHLPYIHALVMEVARWQPITPFVPHAVTTEDTYRNYHIPKGTMCLAVSTTFKNVNMLRLIRPLIEHMVSAFCRSDTCTLRSSFLLYQGISRIMSKTTLTQSSSGQSDSLTAMVK